MNIPELIAAIKDILLGGAAVTMAIVAVKGLQSWSRELKGKTEFETARELIKATYKLRDELAICRSPFIRAQEFPESYLGHHLSEEDAQAYAYVYKNRWEPVWEAIQSFDTHTLEAEALWGNEIRERADQLRQCVRDLNASIQSFLDDKTSGGQHFKADRDFGKKIRMQVSAMKENENENELTKQITDSVGNIEDFIRPHLKRS